MDITFRHHKNYSNDVIYYHITDTDLYEDLEIGERVTVTAPPSFT